MKRSGERGRDTRSGGEGEDQAVLTSPITNLRVPPSREREWRGGKGSGGRCYCCVGRNKENT